MATATQVRASIKSVVEDQPVYNIFHSYWNEVKEKPTELVDPCVAWDQWVINAKEGVDERLKKTQRVQLVVFRSLSSDRTSDQRDQAAEGAADAALNIVLELRGRYRSDLVFDNVLITPIYDESTTFETGVVLQFTVIDTDSLCDTGDPTELPE